MILWEYLIIFPLFEHSLLHYVLDTKVFGHVCGHIALDYFLSLQVIYNAEQRLFCFISRDKTFAMLSNVINVSIKIINS